MSWTKDEERSFQWASKQSAVLREGESEGTYWKKREDEVSGVHEYGFETFQEIEDMLKQNICEDEMRIIIGAAAIKSKAAYRLAGQEEKEQNLEKMENNIEIPDYVYIF